MLDEDKNIFASTNFRNDSVKFGIKTDDRRRHTYVIGKTGSGKTNILETMAVNDIRAGKGLGVIDPHGEFAEKMLDYIPKERLDDVVYFNPADMAYPIAFNPLEQVSSEFRHLIASGIMGVFKKIWVDAWSARMEYILNNTLLALLEFPDATILGVMRMFSEPEYRKKIVQNLKDPVIKAFWVNEYARYSQKFETEAVAAIQNKIGQFVSNPLIRNIIGQTRSSLNMRKVLDDKKIFIANLSKGKIGEDNSALLGAMLITRIQLAAMSRVDIPEPERKDFFLYVDEFQNFATDSFAGILSEARKYRLSLTLAHQYIEQLDEKVRPAVFGNVGTIICFRVGAEDAEFLEKEFMPQFEATDLVNLEKYNIYLKLLIDGIASQPFSAATLQCPPMPAISFKDEIIEKSRQIYARPKEAVEEMIAGEWLATAESVAGEKVSRKFGEPAGRQGTAPVAYEPAPRADGASKDGGMKRTSVIGEGPPVSPASARPAGAPRREGQAGGFVPREPEVEKRNDGFVPREARSPAKDNGFAPPVTSESPWRTGRPRDTGGQARREPPRQEVLPELPRKIEPASDRPASQERQRGERAGPPPMSAPEHRPAPPRSGADAPRRPQNHQPPKQFLKMEDLAKIPPKVPSHEPAQDPERTRASMEDLRKALSERLSKPSRPPGQEPSDDSEQ